MVLLSVAAVVLVMGISFCIIAFTPLRTLIPGYPDAITRQRSVETALRVDSLQMALSRWELYSENLSRVLLGQETINIDSLKAQGPAYMSRKRPDQLEKQDSVLKAALQEEARLAKIDKNLKVLPIEGLHFFPPLKGNIALGYTASHLAIDIAAAQDELVCAVLGGTIVFAGWSDEDGYTVQIQHSGNILSSYSHCQRLLKQKGEEVKAGTAIALAGTTGSTSKHPQLHFELWYNGKRLNPLDYIKF